MLLSFLSISHVIVWAYHIISWNCYRSQLISVPSLCRGKYLPAVEYVQHADRSTASLVEIFRNMQMDEEEPSENGVLDYEVELKFPICLTSSVLLNSHIVYVIGIPPYNSIYVQEKN